MSWLSRMNARITERELRDSWPRALVRAGSAAVLAAVLGALLSLLVGRSWVFGAVMCGWLSLAGVLFSRALVRLDAQERFRSR